MTTNVTSFYHMKIKEENNKTSLSKSMLYNAIQCYTMLYNAIQCYTMLYNKAMMSFLMLYYTYLI